MAHLNTEAPEFIPVATSPPPHLFPTVSISIPTFFQPSLPCSFPLLPSLESCPPSLPFIEVCPPQFSIYNNNVNVYYARGNPWLDPLLKSPFHDPWCYSLATDVAAQGPLPLSILPQAPVHDASVVEEQKSPREGEVEEVVASRRSAVGQRAGRKSARSARSHWRRAEKLQCSEQGKGMRFWRPRCGSTGESCNSERGEEEQKHTTLMIRNIPNKFT